MNKPKIITLSGSTRFIKQFAIMAWLLEKQGNIVLGCHLLPDEYFRHNNVETVNDHLAEHEGVKELLDELHFRKIDISNELLVLNVHGYIGQSTQNEIDYAISKGVPVKYLEPFHIELSGRTLRGVQP